MSFEREDRATIREAPNEKEDEYCRKAEGTPNVTRRVYQMFGLEFGALLGDGHLE